MTNIALINPVLKNRGIDFLTEGLLGFHENSFPWYKGLFYKLT